MRLKDFLCAHQICRALDNRSFTVMAKPLKGASNGLCVHLWASSAFIFASASNALYDQFSHASSEQQAASTLAITNSEQRALRKLSARWNLSLLKRCLAPSNLADTFKTGQQDNMIRPYSGLTIPGSFQPIMPPLICRLLQNYFNYLHESQWMDATRDLKLSKTQFISK